MEAKTAATATWQLKVPEYLFYIPFTLFFIYNFLQTTTFVDTMPVLDTLLLILFGFCVGAKAIIFDNYTRNEAIFPIGFFALSMVSYFSSHYDLLIFIALGIIGAKDIPFKKIVQIFFITGLVLMVIAFIASMFNIIPDLTYMRDGKLRHSFGIIYTTDFAAHVFYLTSAYIYLKKGILKWYSYFIILIMTGVIYYFTDARLDTMLLVLLLIGTTLYQYVLTKNKPTNLPKQTGVVSSLFKLSWLFLPILAIVMNILINRYEYRNPSWIRFDNLLSSRLSMGNLGYTQWGYSLLGKYIPMEGYGGTAAHAAAKAGTINYFVIDSAYIRVILCYGTLLFILIFGMYTWLARKEIKRQNLLFGMFMALVAISSVMDQHFYEFTYNFLLFALLADTTFFKDPKTQLVNSSKTKISKSTLQSVENSSTTASSTLDTNESSMAKKVNEIIPKTPLAKTDRPTEDADKSIPKRTQKSVPVHQSQSAMTFKATSDFTTVHPKNDSKIEKDSKDKDQPSDK